MAHGPLVLYNASNGLSTLVDAGDGLRQKAWLDEVARWLKEAVEPETLKGLGLGRLVNYPSFLDGKGLSSNPIGQAPSIGTFNGIELFSVVPQSGSFGLGDGSAVSFGEAALTQPDPNLANYGNTGSDGLVSVAPRGAAAPAFVLANAENYNLSATDGILKVIVNGQTVSISVGTGAATTADSVVASVLDAGAPLHAFNQAGTTVLLTTLGIGNAQTLAVDRTAGGAGAVIFPAAAATVRRGHGSPLNQMDNTGANPTGLKPQRRILPGSVVISATISGVTVTMTDNKSGAFTPSTGSHTGTINYTTGVTSITYATAPTNATALTSKFKALVPLNLHEPVRHSVSGAEFAIRLK